MKKVLSIVITLALIAVFAGCANLQTGEVSKSDIPTIATTSSVSKNEANAETTTETPSTDVSGESTVATAPASEAVKLTDLTSVADSPKKTDKLADNYGNTYGEAIINSSTHYEYLLDKKYSVLKGTIYVPKGVTSNSICVLTVKADGFVIYNSPIIDKTSKPVDVEVTVSGFNNLVIDWSISSYYFDCCLSDPVLLTETASEPATIDPKTLPISIMDLTSIDKNPEKTEKLTDTFGNEYGNAVCNNIQDKQSWEYLLDNKYSKFKCTIYIPKGSTFNNSVTMTITADGKNIYQSPALKNTSDKVDVDVDISQCNDLKFNFSTSSYYATICLGNAYFYLA